MRSPRPSSSSVTSGIIVERDTSQSTQRRSNLFLEVIAMVLSSGTDAPTLAACALASLTLHDLAIPLLYHTVCLVGTWMSNVDMLALFLHGVVASTVDEKIRQRKMTYLRYLKALILYDRPRRDHVLIRLVDSNDLFPSLRYIEFRHDLAHAYSWLFSQFFNIQHVCIRTYESGKLDPSSSLANWTNVKSLTLYSYYASDYSIQWLREGDGIPLSWQDLNEVTVYPELASHGVILCIEPRHDIPNPFAFMPNPNELRSLKNFTIMIPKESQYDRRRYQAYAQSLRDEQRDLVRIVVGGTQNNQWVRGWAS